MAERSAQYPIVTWEASLDFIKVIDSLKFKQVSYNEVAKKLGLSNVTTKSFTGKISTARQFGLISVSNKTLQLTPVAKNILYPTGTETRDLAIECFKSPPLYTRLIERYEEKALPSEEVLSNILMMEYRITQSAKDNAAHVFLESADSLGLIQGGVLTLNPDVETVPEGDSKSGSQLTFSQEAEVSSPTSMTMLEKTEYIKQTVPTSSGKIASIQIPIDASEDDLYLIQDMLHAIMRRKFHIEIED